MKTKLFREEKGSTLAMLTIAMFVMACCAGMAIDIGAIASFKSQLQVGIDAAALAGARGLITDNATAITEAIAVGNANRYQNRGLGLNPNEISFTGSTQVDVQATRTVNLYFLRLAGVNTATIVVSASAMMGELVGTNGLKPWAVPDENWNFGDPVMLKLPSNGGGNGNGNGGGGNGPPDDPASWHYPVCFPPVNKGNPQPGGNEYRNNIINGCDCTVEVGDVLMVEPGNMQGPTTQGVNTILAQDPNAYWDGGVVNSSYSGFSSPRICKIAIIDPDQLPGNGRSEVTIARFGVFFIEGMQGQALIGRYMRAATIGEIARPGRGSGSDLYGVKLVN